MELVLGPCPPDDMIAWTKIARRVLVEARGLSDEVNPSPDDQIAAWSPLIEQWASAATAAAASGERFCWTEPMEPEVGEYLLYALDRFIHSSRAKAWITDDEASSHQAMTSTVIKAFVEALWNEGADCQRFADQMLAHLNPDLR